MTAIAQDPPGLLTPLWDHQRAGVAFARDRAGSLIAAEVGCGKSLTAIALLHAWDSRRVLIASPLSVCGVWPEQFRRHSGHRWHVARLDSGSIAKRTEAASLAARHPRSVTVINHEAAWRSPFREWALAAGYDAVIVDESHRIAAPGSRVSMFFSALGRRVPRRLCLSGTPLSHSPLSIYGQARFLDTEVFGTSFTRLRGRYAIMGGYRDPRGIARTVVGWQNMDEFERKLGTLCHRVKKEDVLDLPPEIESERRCQLEPEARRVYRDLERDLVAEVGGGTVTASNALVKLLRLQQITGGSLVVEDEEAETREVRTVSTAKARLLSELLEDVGDEPVVVFARFVADLDAIRVAGEAAGRRCGEVSGRRRDLTPHGTFPEDLDLLGVQVQSGGLGVDLHRAAVAVYYSIGFSLAEALQCRGRLHRPGQDRPVRHIKLIAEGTVDVDVARALDRREDLVEGVLARMSAGTQSTEA